MAPEKIIGYVRDAGCVLVGLGGITYQIASGHISAEALTACTVLLGYAGAANVRQLRPSNGRGRVPSSSSSRSDSSSRPSSHNSDGDE